MSGVGIIEYWSQETSHSSSHHLNDDGVFNYEILEVSAGDGRRGHGSLENSKSYSHNCGVYHIGDNGIGGYRSQETSHSSYRKHGVYQSGDQIGDDGRGGYRSQETNHSSSLNSGPIVNVGGRGGYRSQTIKYPSNNPGGHVILPGLS